MLKFHALNVREVRQESEDAIRLVLDVPADLAADYRAAAGQHVVLRSRSGTDEARRTYSLTGPAGALPLTLGVRIHPHGQFSRHLAQNVHAGDALDVMPPNGSFGAALATAEATAAGKSAGATGTYVAFASGCGITPVLSIVRTLLETQPAARVQLYYGNRHTARAMFLEDLLALKDRFPARLALHFVMSAEPQDADVYNGRIDAAKVARFAEALFDPRAVRAFFICGPGTMIGDVTGALHSLGVQPQRIHAEHFTVETSAATTRAETAAQPRVAVAGMADVTVLMDGRRRTFTMRRGGETLLDAAASAGIDLPYSCRAGVCSTCRTRLARGEVEMDQNFALEDWELERGFILACQAHPTTAEIELDYDER